MRASSLSAPAAHHQQQPLPLTARWRPPLSDRPRLGRSRLCRLSLLSSRPPPPPPHLQPQRLLLLPPPHAKGLRLGIGNSPSSPRKRMSDYLLEEGLASGDPTLLEAASAPPTPRDLLPRPLPPGPKKASVGAVLQFLGQLALEDSSLRWRLVTAALLVVASKATGIAGPLHLKDAVDALATEAAKSSSSTIAASSSTFALPSLSSALASRPATLHALLLFTLSRMLSALARELKGPLFAPVAASAARRVAHGTYRRVLALELDYHVRRRSGATARVLERGSRAVAMVFRAVAVRTKMIVCFEPEVVENVSKKKSLTLSSSSSLPQKQQPTSR